MLKIIARFIAAFKLPTNRFLGTLDHGKGLPKQCLPQIWRSVKGW